ncbi:MAG: 16S rRNA (guanine(966)-N(2))-methyltransferase RsmD [Candidatus Omnitrophota bacterium]
MRILTGKYKNKLIIMPKGIRPTQNIVRKALFDTLGDIEGQSFLELFAGSASVGLEAVSRGASELALVESNRQCQQAIRKNIELFGLSNCVLYPQDAGQAVKFLHKNEKKFDIIFFDPPYYKDMAKKTLQILMAYDILAPNGFIIIQHFKKDSLQIDNIGKLECIKQSIYGDTVLSFFQQSD